MKQYKKASSVVISLFFSLLSLLFLLKDVPAQTQKAINLQQVRPGALLVSTLNVPRDTNAGSRLEWRWSCNLISGPLHHL